MALNRVSIADLIAQGITGKALGDQLELRRLQVLTQVRRRNKSAAAGVEGGGL
jgi:hypothetical protein